MFLYARDRISLLTEERDPLYLFSILQICSSIAGDIFSGCSSSYFFSPKLLAYLLNIDPNLLVPPLPITCNLFPVPSKNIPPHTHFQSSLILSIAQRGARSSSPPAPLASYHTSSTPSSFSSSAIATGPSNLKTHHFSSFQFRHMYLATPPPCLHFSLLPYHPPTLSYLSLPCFNFLILVSLHYITIKTHPSYPKIHQEHVR